MAYSYVLYSGNGSNKNFAFSFPYLDASHVKVKVDGVATTAWSFLSANTVQMATAPASGAVVEVYRETPKDTSVVDFSDGSVLLEKDLDLLATFNLYCAQESVDVANRALYLNSLGVYDAGNKRIVNVATPVNPDDAVNKAYADVIIGAAAGSAASAAASAAAASAAYDSFDDRYLGAKSVAPTTDNDDNALLVGAVYWDTVSNQMFTWSGSQWKPTFVTGNTTRSLVTATAGQTVVPTPTYVVGNNSLQVFFNGSKLNLGLDYTETSQNSITFTAPLSAGDEVEVIAFQAYPVGTTSAQNVSYDNITVQEALDTAKPLATYAALRAYTGTATRVQVGGRTNYFDGAAGIFVRTGSAADNDGTILVDALGRSWVRQFDGPVDVRWWGAVGSTNDEAAAIQKALSYLAVKFEEGKNYRIDSPLTLQSNQKLYLHGATISPSASLTSAAIAATSVTGIRVYGGKLEGTGTAFSTGNEHLMLFTTCDDIQIFGTKFTKSRNEGLRLVGCSNCLVAYAEGFDNYGAAFQDRDGTSNKFIGLDANNNGRTGTATGVNGRGLLIWRSIDTQVVGGSFKANTEYGLRVYSQSGDAAGSVAVKVEGAHAEDNGVTDFYVYNEGGSVAQAHFSNCTVRRTTDPTGACVALQGSNITWQGGSITKVGARMTIAPFNFYGLSASRISGVTVSNVGQLISWSPTAICDDVLFEANIVDCATVGALYGTKVTFRGNKFKHGGSGTTDIAIDAGSTYSPIIDNNEFDGFYRNVNWVAQAMTLRNNTSRNTSDVSLRMNGDGVSGLVSSGNNWDTGSNPTWVATAYRQGNSNARLTVYGSTPPTTLTWARGDRMLNANPTVGQPKAWLNTATGTPGTWVSEGNL